MQRNVTDRNRALFLGRSHRQHSILPNMPEKKAALPTFKKKREDPLWSQAMLTAAVDEEKPPTDGKPSRGSPTRQPDAPEIQRAESFRSYKPKAGNVRRGWSMKLISIDPSSEVPLLEQLQRALNSGKVVARTLDLFREMDADKSGTVSRREFARAMGMLGLEDLSVAEALFDDLDKDHSGEIVRARCFRSAEPLRAYASSLATFPRFPHSLRFPLVSPCPMLRHPPCCAP